MIRAITLLPLAAVLAITGCQDPYTGDREQPAPAQATAAPTPRSDSAAPGPPAAPAPSAPTHPSRTARGVAGSFATRWINWDWRSAAAQQRALARLATGELARTLQANGTSARIDATLTRDKPASRGTVAVIQLNATRATAAGIVVTHEQTYTDGHADLGGKHYRVYLIQLHREPGRWEVSAWRPQA